MSLDKDKISIGDIANVDVSFNRVLVKVKKIEEKTSGGIIIPEQQIQAELTQGGVGHIAKLGKLAFLDHEETTPKIGDKVRFGTYRGSLYEDSNGAHYRCIQDSDIELIIKGDA